jgi:hypothetical protein
MPIDHEHITNTPQTLSQLILHLKAANEEKDKIINRLLSYHEPDAVTDKLMLNLRYKHVTRSLILQIVQDILKIIEGV